MDQLFDGTVEQNMVRVIVNRLPSIFDLDSMEAATRYKERKDKPVTKGPVGSTLAVMTLPMILGMFGSLMGNAADTYYVGLLGTIPLAAIGFTIPVVSSVLSLAIGLNIATTVIVARAIGSGDLSKAVRITTDSLILCVLIALVVMVFGVATIRPLFGILGANGSQIELITRYMEIWYLGIGFGFVGMVSIGVLRATGDTIVAGIFLALSGAINIILAPIFIFGWFGLPPMGIRGAAVASTSTWGLIAAASLFLLTRNKKLLGSVAPFKTLLTSWDQMLRIGLPAAFSNLLLPISIGIMTAIAAKHGTAAVAAYGVGARLEPILLVAVVSLASTLSPFVSQNFGANHYDRIRLAIAYSFRFAILWQLFVYAIVVLFGKEIASHFSEDIEVQTIIRQFLWIVPISYGCRGIVLLTSTSFNALHMPLFSIGSNITHLLIFYVPLGLLGAHLGDMTGVFVGIAGANIMASIVLYAGLRKALDARIGPGHGSTA